MKLLLAAVAASAALGQTAVTERVNLSALAAQVVKEAGLARQAAGDGNKPAALDHIARGEDLLARIRKAAGAAGIGANGKLIIPISGERETETVYAPVKRGKEDTMSAARMRRDTNVRQVTKTVRRATLDAGYTQERMNAARAALDAGDMPAAQLALSAVERQAIPVGSENNYTPLLRARQNLVLAKARIAEGRYKDARMPLKSAAQALADYQSLNPGPRSIEAANMRAQMDAYADKIGRDHADAERLIRDWSGTIDEWYRGMTR